MKKLLSILAISSLVATTSVNVVACNEKNDKDKTMPDPIPEVVKTRFSDKEYDDALGTFSFEQKADGIKLISNEQKTAFGWNSSTEKAYSIDLSQEVMDDIFILPFDLELETSLEKPFDNEMISLITFDPDRIYNDYAYWSQFWYEAGLKSREGTIVNNRRYAETLRTNEWQSNPSHYKENVIRRDYDIESRDGTTLTMTVLIVVQDYLTSSYLFNGKNMLENFIRNEKYSDFFGNVEFSLRLSEYLWFNHPDILDFTKEIEGKQMIEHFKTYILNGFNDLRKQILDYNSKLADYLFSVDEYTLDDGHESSYTSFRLDIRTSRKKGTNLNKEMLVLLSGPKKD
ncbi:hypothetical protein SCHIN_v1c04350 [Spiroplasma chinense]|uniref:Lipoprotein n=1 Tax=Spiroplasma chinense TaxID=216932 RepID=A0A5B9Y6D7_9MOLU|nr:lipoprotein [Spiroplasma chinense]QEH61632.1 hypothetical protein SCHIN_v1c04350 [Spiroplasma chinense]